MENITKISELVDAQYSECAWIRAIARKVIDRILRDEIGLDNAYENLRGMKKAVKETRGAC